VDEIAAVIAADEKIPTLASEHDHAGAQAGAAHDERLDVAVARSPGGALIGGGEDMTAQAMNDAGVIVHRHIAEERTIVRYGGRSPGETDVRGNEQSAAFPAE
jgi:hypothetical protein